MKGASLLFSAGSSGHKVRAMRQVSRCIVLAMLLALLAELVAVIRHASLIAADAKRIMLLCACEAAVEVLAIYWLRPRPVQGEGTESRKYGAFWFAATIVVLAFCPEWKVDIATATWHLVTVAAGFLLFFGTLRAVLLPGSEEKGFKRLEVLFGTLGAAAMACAIYAPHTSRPMLLVALAGGVLVSYAGLARPLALYPNRAR